MSLVALGIVKLRVSVSFQNLPLEEAHLGRMLLLVRTVLKNALWVGLTRRRWLFASLLANKLARVHLKMALAERTSDLGGNLAVVDVAVAAEVIFGGCGLGVFV